MAAVLLLSVAIMVGWLIVHYDLWEAADDDDGILPAGRKRAALFNAATVLTLTAGVIALYALLLTVALGSGFESQDAVRRVAFGVRERHRREKAHAKPD